MREDLDQGHGHHHGIECKIQGNQNDGDPDCFPESPQEDSAQECQQEQGDQHVLPVQPAGNNRILNQVRSGVGSGKRHGDHEVCCGEAKQDQDQ